MISRNFDEKYLAGDVESMEIFIRIDLGNNSIVIILHTMVVFLVTKTQIDLE